MRYNVTEAENQQEIPFICGRSSETIRRISHIDESLATLIGLLFTDGCVSPKNKTSWRIYFAVKSKPLVLVFRDCMLNIFNIEQRRVRMDMTRDGLTRAIVDSKDIGEFLTDSFGTFRTLAYADGELPKARLPVSALITSGQVDKWRNFFAPLLVVTVVLDFIRHTALAEKVVQRG